MVSEEDWWKLSHHYQVPDELRLTQPVVGRAAQGIVACLGTQEQLTQLEQQQGQQPQAQPMEAIDVTCPEVQAQSAGAHSNGAEGNGAGGEAKPEGVAAQLGSEAGAAQDGGPAAAYATAADAAAMIAAATGGTGPSELEHVPMRQTRSRARRGDAGPAAPAPPGLPSLQAQEQQAAPQARDVWDANRKLRGAWYENPAAALAMGPDAGALEAAAERRASHAAAGAAGVPVLITLPPVCQLYLKSKAEQERAQALGYDRAEVMVELITESELATAWAAPAGMERRSKRARKGRQPVTISCTTTLRDLKIQVVEALGVHPLNSMVRAPVF